MLQLKSKGPDLWDTIIPEEARALPEDLAHVDELLRDERFMEPFVRRFDEKTGRRGLPVATYLRLMYLRRKNRLGYEALVDAVSASIPWRSFCGIGCQDRVPSPSTLAGLTQKYGEETLVELHGLVSEDLREWKILRRRKADAGAARSARRVQSDGLGRRLLSLVRRTMDQARRLAARIKNLRSRRKVQMTLDLADEEPRRG
ncbi:MAG: transposase [Elusimicrobia bacterium]|nr:transposase [Elusimicrobiota bacterium]